MNRTKLTFGRRSLARVFWNQVSLLGLISLCLASLQIPHAQAAEAFIRWPQLREVDAKNTETSLFNPLLNGSGRYLAITRATENYNTWERPAPHVQVWEVQSDGNLGKRIWDSGNRFGRSILHGMTWWGDRLLISKIDDPTPWKPLAKLNELDTDIYWHNISSLKGNTVCVQPQTGIVKRIPKLTAYHELHVSPAGTYLAAADPTHDLPRGPTDEDSNWPHQFTEFYRLDAKQWRATWLGRVREGDDAGKGIGWHPREAKFYVSKTNGLDIANSDFRRKLLSVTPQGKFRQLIPDKASIEKEGDTAAPLPGWNEKGQLSLLVNYFNRQASALLTVDSSGVQREVAWKDIFKLRPPNVQWVQSLAVTPNGRFVLLKDVSSDDDKVLTDVWALDVQAKKRRKIARLYIERVLQWSGDKLLLLIAPQPKDDLSPRQFGVLHFPEATLPADDPKLDEMVSQAPWEDAAPPARARMADEQAAIAFLNDPDLIPAALPAQPGRFPTALKGYEKHSVFPLNGLDDRASFIALELGLARDGRRIAFTARAKDAISSPPSTNSVSGTASAAIALHLVTSGNSRVLVMP